jgi:hypothetical protein
MSLSPMRLSSLVAAGIVLLGPALAAGDAPRVVLGAPTIDDIQLGRQPIAPITTAAVAQSHIVYLNKTGVTLVPGANDSRTNKSSLVSAQTVIPVWNPTPGAWGAVMSCMREIFGGFDLTIVDTDPGGVPHIEAVFGGHPSALGLASNVGGVSPFTTDCSIIDNAVVFTFTQVVQPDPRTLCEVMAQEVAHAYGLDHELLARDPMTYLPYDGNRTFQNQNAPCGEDRARPCGIDGSTCRATQNSVALLTERVGRRGAPGDVTAPNLRITSPGDRAVVPPGFAVTFNASDANGIRFASLYIDGEPSGSVSSLPFTFTTPMTLQEGPHQLRIEVTDGANQKSQMLAVTVQKGAPPPEPPSGDDADGDVLGGCAAAPGTPLALALALLGLRRRRR